MRNVFISVITIVCCLLTIKSLYAQDECWDKEFENKLQVTQMFFNTSRDTLFVTIKNDCDTCDKSVYTGVIVYTGSFINALEVEDTLAIDAYYTSEFTPDNNTERTYTAIVKKDFDLSLKNFKVGLVEVCSSISFAPDIILSSKENNIRDKKKVLLQNNGILKAEHGQIIKDVSMYNLAGQLVEKESGIFRSDYKLKKNKPGIYLISVRLASNEVVNIKYMNTTHSD